MLKVIINAYACSPDMGSEPGMGWNWCVNLAKYCELFIITEGEFRDRIEHTVPMLPQGANMHFYYNPVPERVRQMCWNQGDWRFYKYYKDWQKKTADIAREICKKEKIDILHQLNMIGFREPGYLWQVSCETGIPFVWGPVDAKESFPMAYANGASIKTKFFLLLKNIITKCQLRYGKRVHEAANTASLVLSSSSNSVISFKKYFGIESPLMNETGTYPIDDQKNACDVQSSFDILWSGKTDFDRLHRPPEKNDIFEIIWVGKFDFRKQLMLALDIVKMLETLPIRLHVLGTGQNPRYYEKYAKESAISDKIVWHGQVAHEDVNRLMRQSHLFLFTSVMEGTSTVIMEALQNNLPVICFDACGMSAVINEKVGYKLPLTNPKQSVEDFSVKIEFLLKHRDVLAKMSENCKKRAEELSWDNKAKKMVELYEDAKIK